MEFLLAEQLKKEFIVYSKWEGEEKRTLCEIRKKGTKEQNNDLLIVMLNPGNSSSFGTKDNDGFIESKPDQTMYQLMRLMRLKNYSKISILNLSSQKNSNSVSFFEEINKMNTTEIEDYKSKFLLNISEIQKIKYERLIFAWGDLKGELLKMKELELLEYFNNSAIVLYKKTFRHPSPLLFEKKKEWLEDIAKTL